MIGDAYKAAALKRRQLLDAGSRYWIGDGYDERVAVHEAAHVVVGFRLGLDPTYATVDMGDIGVGYAGLTVFGVRTTDDRAFDHAVTMMAGLQGEALFHFEADDSGGKTDLKQARTLLSRSSDTIADARRTARRLLQANPGALIAITIALLTKRSLDQDAIAAIMADHVDDADDDDDDDGKVDFKDAMATRKLIFYQRA